MEWFGPTGKYADRFEMFVSNATYDTDEFDFVFERKNQMFSDQTKRLEDIGDKTYFQWVGKSERQCCCCCWSLLYSAVLHSCVDSLRLHAILQDWLAFIVHFLNIRWSGVLTVLA